MLYKGKAFGRSGQLGFNSPFMAWIIGKGGNVCEVLLLPCLAQDLWLASTCRWSNLRFKVWETTQIELKSRMTDIWKLLA
jgi:hypothetical protein